MRKLFYLIAASLLVFSCKTGSVKIGTSQGDLLVTPMTDNSVRVQMMGEPTHNVEELIFTEKVATPAFEKTEDASAITIKMAGMTVVFDKASETLAYYGKDGALLFKEAPGTRVLDKTTVGGTPIPASSTGRAKLVQPDPIQGDPTYYTSQTFEMQADDHQFGTGQFQDGYLDIMGLSRRLVQLNTQTAIPMVISSKGYGILWHNYGETFFNKPSQTLTLSPVPQAAPAVVPVPGMRPVAAPKVFAGEFSVDKAGKYCLYVYGGDHVARGGHKIMVDGELLFEDSDNWVTAVATFADLSAGTHRIETQGSSEDTVEFGWRAVDQTTTFSSPVSQNLDYTVFAGNADEVIGTYRTLTGPIPELPEWAFGYIHCRERYDTQAELLENAREFKRRGIPVSCIVQDWQWWGKTGWNSMVFDKDKYPDPKAMVDELHDLGMKIMISVWSRVETGSVLGDNLTEKGYFIPGTEWVDFFNPEAAEYYWESFRDSLVKIGFDAWWFDSTEPDNDYELMNRRVANNTIPGNVYRNVYPLLV
ncbi:MAG: glycosyl hydrolase family 31, partial [Bacteroidales bacterium]|nr:glycosyl hydrolase family 31 [Bacteroidales bacterium]